MPTKEELKALAEGLTPYLLTTEKKEAKPMSEDRQFCPSCGAPAHYGDIQNTLELEKDRHQRDVQDRDALIEKLKGDSTGKVKELTDQLQAVANGHIEPSADLLEGWRSCPDCAPKLANLLKDNLSPDEVAAWLRERQAMGVVKDTDGVNKIFKGIKTS